MEVLGARKPRSFQVLATRPASMYVHGNWSFAAHDDEHLPVCALGRKKPEGKRSPSFVLRLVRASIRKFSLREDSKLQSSDNINMHVRERTTIVPDANNISRVPTMHEADQDMPGLERVMAHAVDESNDAIPLQNRIRALSSFINYTDRVPSMQEMDDIMPGYWRAESRSDCEILVHNAIRNAMDNASVFNSSHDNSDSDSGFIEEWYDSSEDPVNEIPEAFHGIMNRISQDSLRTSLSASSLNTVIHHADMSAPHVATIADAYEFYLPRMVPGPERGIVLRSPESLPAPSSAESTTWECFANAVMLARTLSQCHQRATQGLRRSQSQRLGMATGMGRFETREADFRPSLNRSGTDRSYFSYRYLEGPTKLVVTNP